MTLSKWCRGLTAVSVAALVAGCGWFDGGSSPMGKARPGADRAVAPSATLPAPAGGSGIEAGVAPIDDVAPAIGSVIPAKGGQKAQKEAAEKDAAERDAKARAQREERDAAERAAKAAAKEKGGAAGVPAAAVDAPAAPVPPAADPNGPVLPPIPPAQEPRT
jgi:hypothetical protein